MLATRANLLTADHVQRRQWRIRGRVQGVGFRPFVYRLAREHDLTGHVLNDETGVVVEAQGTADHLMQFASDIRAKKPALAVIREMVGNKLAPVENETEFTIDASLSATATASADVSPDLAVCPRCLAELHDPHDKRRHGYPLINCTECGPRFSIIRKVPYDRGNTTMSAFAMCDACRSEYENPADRRFHAQPTACWACGPEVILIDRSGQMRRVAPVEEAARRLAEGEIITIKGLGGFHLAVRADQERAVRRLRDKKHRLHKPFALMVADLDAARRLVELSDGAAALMTSPVAPIVLAPRRPHGPVAPSVAPGNHRLGVMIAYTPLHHRIFDFLRGQCPALVMTSANDTDEPLVFQDDEAVSHVGLNSDAILLHRRPIERPVDDSVVIDAAGRPPIVVRRSRGFVPTSIALPAECRSTGICMGGDLKCVVGVVRDGAVILSQHFGDLAHARTYANFKRAAADLMELFNVQPKWVAHDMHPAYVSTLYARQLAASLHIPCAPVQHHYAHAMAALIEHGQTGPALAVVCDGTGYGPDGTIWGGELLAVDLNRCKRVGHLAKIRIAGGDAAARQPWRSALSLVQAALGDGFLDHDSVAKLAPRTEDAHFVAHMLKTGTNCVTSTSAGRVFDGLAALLGLCCENTFEAQAPIALESAAQAFGRVPKLGDALFELRGDDCLTIELAPLVREILYRLRDGVPVEELAAIVHDQFVAAWEAAVVKASDQTGLICVVLSGGVFCNEIIDRELSDRLAARGLHVLRHELVPPNDGGLALGQAAIAAYRARRTNKIGERE